MKNKKLIFFGITLFFLIGIIPFIQSQANIDCYECLSFNDCPEGCTCYDNYASHTGCGCYSGNLQTCECITPDFYCQGWNECALYEYIPPMQLPEDFICYSDSIKDADYDLGHCTQYACALGGDCTQNSELWWTKSYADDYTNWICCGDDREDSDGVLIKSADGYSSVCCPNSNYIYDDLSGECKFVEPIESCENYEEEWRTKTKEHDYCDYTDFGSGCVRDRDYDGLYDQYCFNNNIYNVTLS